MSGLEHHHTLLSLPTKIVLLFVYNFLGSASGQDQPPCYGLQYGRLPHPTLCSMYTLCTDYKAKDRVCRTSEHFNPKSLRCEPISEARCVEAPTSKPNIECSPNETMLEMFSEYQFRGASYLLSRCVYTSDVDATHDCESLCGYLVEVDDAAEELFARDVIRQGGVLGLLVAGTDKYAEDVWVIDRDRRRMPYANWNPGEPNNLLNEDCMCIISGHKGMSDCYCNRGFWKIPFLCEVPPKKNNKNATL